MKDTNTKISLGSRTWNAMDEERACRPFVAAGFSDTQEIMDLRVYDMLNICGIDRIMAEEMMYVLYRLFNADEQADDALYTGFLDQYFDFEDWRKKHPDMSGVLVKDIIMAEGMNKEALCWLFNRAAKRFWKSPEYTREYRYWSYRDLLDQKAKEAGHGQGHA